eukprot:gene9113-1415_t
MGQALGISSPVTHYNVHNWTSSDLDVAISEANEICSRLAPCKKRRLKFCLVPTQQHDNHFPESGIFWRLTVRIQPIFILDDGSEEHCTRVLSLWNFARVYQFITETCGENCHSLLDLKQTFEDAPECGEKCGICFENDPQEILPCLHSFCESCLRSWHDISTTCPMCRDCLTNDMDSFVSISKPSFAQVNEYLVNSFKT